MKYYAFVEENQNVENARMCPTLETAFAVSIMANTEKPVAAVRDNDGNVITIDPRQQSVKVDWIMRSNFILIELDGDVLTLSSHDNVPTISTDESVLLVHCTGNNYVVGNIGRQLTIDDIKKSIHPADVTKSAYEYGIGPLVKKIDRLNFKYFTQLYIEGNIAEYGYTVDMDSRIIPDGKLLVINGTFGNATEMRFIGKISSLIKLHEDTYNSHYQYYIQHNGKFYNVKNPKIVTTNLK